MILLLSITSVNEVIKKGKKVIFKGKKVIVKGKKVIVREHHPSGSPGNRAIQSD